MSHSINKCKLTVINTSHKTTITIFINYCKKVKNVTVSKSKSKSKSKYHYVGKIVERHHANSKKLKNKTILKYTK